MLSLYDLWKLIIFLYLFILHYLFILRAPQDVCSWGDPKFYVVERGEFFEGSHWEFFFVDECAVRWSNVVYIQMVVLVFGLDYRMLSANRLIININIAKILKPSY